MRICFLHMDFDVGGGGEYDTIYLSVALKRAGHEVSVITSGGKLCPMMEQDGVRVVATPLIPKVRRRSLITTWRARKPLADIVEEFSPDVLNPQGTHMGWAGGAVAKVLRKRGRALPNIVTIPMMLSMRRLYYMSGSWVINRSADQVIVENTDELRRLRGGGMKRPASLVYTAVPPWRLEEITETRTEIRRRMGWTDDQVVFLMPARVTHQKNHDLVFEVLARPRLRKLPILCWMPGEGPLLKRHRRTVRRLGLEDRVVLPGYQPDMMALYKAADVFLLSTHFESLPVSIREAMLAKLPVIATNVNGIPEAVRDGKTGSLVGHNDADELAEAVEKLAADSGQRARFGEAGHRLLQERFNYEDWADRTVAVYREVRGGMGLEPNV